jgi:hypothetical protein
VVREKCVYKRESEMMLCVCFLMLDSLLCRNHCRSTQLYIPSILRSWPPYFPPIARLLAQKPRARAVTRAEPCRSTDSGVCSDSWLCSCFAPARASALAPV